MVKMKRQCKSCSKRRDLKFYNPSGSFTCDLCKIAKKHGQKLAHKEELPSTWIKRLDKLVGGRVRSREGCESPRSHVCKGAFQWCHGISRSYHVTRHMEKNGFRMCQGEHYYFTNHPLEWEAFLEKKWGNEGLAFMKRLALSGDKVDYKELYNKLKVE